MSSHDTWRHKYDSCPWTQTWDGLDSKSWLGWTIMYWGDRTNNGDDAIPYLWSRKMHHLNNFRIRTWFSHFPLIFPLFIGDFPATFDEWKTWIFLDLLGFSLRSPMFLRRRQQLGLWLAFCKPSTSQVAGPITKHASLVKRSEAPGFHRQNQSSNTWYTAPSSSDGTIYLSIHPSIHPSIHLSI